MIYDIYSKRNKEQLPDVYSYVLIDKKLKIQIGHIIVDFLQAATSLSETGNFFFKTIHDAIAREHGELNLYSYRGPYNYDHYSIGNCVLNYFYQLDNTEKVLDIIEFIFRCIENFRIFQEKDFRHVSDETIRETIADLNSRLRENSIGFKFENSVIIKVSNELLYSTIIQPTLHYLSSKEFQPIQNEFLRAHEHFRHSRFSDCILECSKAFESTMKIICHIRKYSYSQKDTASQLVNTLYEKKFIPNHLKVGLSGLRSCLGDLIPPVRNKISHGKGIATIEVTESLATFILNITGSTIIFLLDSLENAQQ